MKTDRSRRAQTEGSEERKELPKSKSHHKFARPFIAPLQRHIVPDKVL